MLRKNNPPFLHLWLLMSAFILLVPCCAMDKNTEDSLNIWYSYTTTQKKVSVSGVADCYRTITPDKNAFMQSDLRAAIKIVDTHATEKKIPFGNIILQSLSNAPIVKPDVHAEHWRGPTGFHSGLWWRSLNEPERQAYVQGVFWCTKTRNPATAHNTKTVKQAIHTLNGWYVIQDENWTDPRSNSRVDVSVIKAMQQTGILFIKEK